MSIMSWCALPTHLISYMPKRRLMNRAPNRRGRRSEYVAEQIVALIRDRGLHPGDLLPSETRLMEELQVGRSSVREALRGLSAVGLVEIQQGRGTVIKSQVPLAGPQAVGVEAISTALARGMTDALLEARTVIEVKMASLAAQRATQDDLQRLQELVEAERR